MLLLLCTEGKDGNSPLSHCVLWPIVLAQFLKWVVWNPFDRSIIILFSLFSACHTCLHFPYCLYGLRPWETGWDVNGRDQIDPYLTSDITEIVTNSFNQPHYLNTRGRSPIFPKHIRARWKVLGLAYNRRETRDKRPLDRDPDRSWYSYAAADVHGAMGCDKKSLH